MNNNNNNQEAKANLWGSLAAQLEMQCGDVLDNNVEEEEEDEPLPLYRRFSSSGSSGNGGGGGQGGVAPPPQGGNNNNSMMNNNNRHRAAQSAAPMVAHAASTTKDNNSSSEWNKVTASAVASSSSNNNSLLNHQFQQQQQQQQSTQLYHLAAQSRQQQQQQQHGLPQHHHYQQQQQHYHQPPPAYHYQSSAPNNHQSQKFSNNNNNNTRLPPSGTTTNTPSTTTSILKDWIVTKKVDREIKEATYHAATTTLSRNSSIDSTKSSNHHHQGGGIGGGGGGGRMGKFQKEYIVKCVKAAYLLVGKLVDAEATTNDNDGGGGGKRHSSDNNNFHNNRRSNNNNNNHEELILPTPRDIDEDIISITENDQTGEIVDVTFNLYRQQQGDNNTTTFNWDIQGADDDDDDDNEMFSFGDNDARKKGGGRNNHHKSTSSSNNNNNNNNNQDDDNNNQLGNMLGALGKLFYILFTEGESVPNNTEDDDDVVVDVDGYNSTIATTTTPVTNRANSSSSTTTTSRKRKVNSSSSRDSSNNNNNNEKKKGSSSKESKVSKKKSREEEAILDILLNFAMPGDTDREDDYIIESMKKVGNLPIHLCRFVSDLLYSARVLEKNDDGGGGGGDNGGGNGGDTTATAATTTTGNNHHQQQHLHHKDSIFTSLSDVHSDLKQMIDFPDAFLYGTVNSRWEIVFGSNHVFGREKEMQLLMNAVRRIESFSNDSMARQQQQQQQLQMIHPHHHPLQQRRTKEVVIISGHAGTGKSLLVQEIRKPLQAQGWIFLRCKFEKKMYPEPLSVIALGFDEFFASCALCSKDVTAVTDAGVQQSCCCSNGCCSRKICEKLERFIGLAGLTTLSQLMPSLRRILNDVYPNRYFHGDEGLGTTNNVRGQNHQHLFVTLLDVLSQLRPVLFFTDDLQFAGGASLELLNGLINRVGAIAGGTSSSLLFVGSHRTVGTESNPLLSKMLKQFEASDFVNTTQITLHGFELESLNEMVSEALCLPRRKTRSLAEVVHQKTLGVPLFVVEFLDALLTENLLVHNSATGWGWDVDSIDLKKISSGVAELLACKLEQLPNEVLSAVKLLSVLGTHIDRGVLEVVKSYDGSDGSTLIPSLYTAQREGLLDIAGPTFTFMHDTIKRAAFDLILEADRIPIMLRIVACLLPHCKQDEQADSYLFTTVDIINRIGSQAVSKNLGQSRAFAQLNLDAGKKSANFPTAMDYFEAGITFLQGDYWNDQYELTLSLFESAAAANYSAGRHDQVAIQTNKIFAMAKSFEDKFKSYCLYINVLAIGNTEKAMEQIYHLLKSLGEDINPNAISAPMAIVDFSSLKQMLGGARKDVLLQLPPMTDRNKLMSMKLMAMLVLYYNQQMTHMSGYFSCKMIRMSIQHGHCEDTVFALAVFSGTTMNFLSDTQEASSLAKCAISMSRLYKSEQLIPRIYSRIYGAVLCFTQPMATALPPLLKACRISFARGTSEQSIFNTMIYVTRSLQSGKKIPVLLDEVKAFALKHNQLNHMGILQLFLAPVYKFLSSISGISFDPSTLLPQLAVAPIEDVVQTALAKKEMVFVRVAVVTSLGESLYLRDFAKAYQTMARYPTLFQMLDDRQQLRITEFEVIFIAGLFSFYWARETREPHWIQRGMNALTAYEDWAKLNPWDFLHRYHMLKAELHHTQGDTNGAIESFDTAIANTKKHNYPSHEGLACEWAAHFYDSIGSTDKTKEMIQKSHDAYIKWGATKKADALIKLLQMVPSVHSSTLQNQQCVVPFPGMNLQSAAL